MGHLGPSLVLANYKVFLKYVVGWNWLLVYPFFFLILVLQIFKKLHSHFKKLPGHFFGSEFT